MQDYSLLGINLPSSTRFATPDSTQELQASKNERLGLNEAENVMPSLSQFKAQLSAAQELEQQGYGEKAHEQYAELFWDTPIAREILDQLQALGGHQIDFRYLCLEYAFGKGSALFLYGKIIYAGDKEHNVTKNPARAMEHFRSAFANGCVFAFDVLVQEAKRSADAHYQLSVIYTKGVSENPKKHFYHLKAAADAGHPTARLEMADIFAKKGTKEDYITAIQYINGVSKDHAKLTDLSNTIFNKAITLLISDEGKAKELFILAASLGHTNAKFEVGKIYESRIPSSIQKKHNEDNALKFYLETLKDSPHHAEAALRAGKILEKRGDLEAAKKYFAIAAKKGTLEAKARLGEDPDAMMLFAKELQQEQYDSDEVITLFIKAGDLGSNNALYELGQIFEKRYNEISLTNLTHYNLDKALGYYERAALGNDPHAPSALRAAKIYTQNGESVLAKRFYKIAAASGNVEAKANLGDPSAAYQHALELTEQNQDEAAFKFYKFAADKNHPDAAFFLYQKYSRQVLTGFSALADHYFEIACKYGNKEAIAIHEKQNRIKEAEQAQQQKEREEKEQKLALKEAEQQKIQKEKEAQATRDKQLRDFNRQLQQQQLNRNLINDASNEESSSD